MVKSQCGNPVLLIKSLPPATSFSTSQPVSPPSFLTRRPSELFSHTVIHKCGLGRAERGGVGWGNNVLSCGKGKVWRWPGEGKNN